MRQKDKDPKMKMARLKYGYEEKDERQTLET